jgi:hypothetical protein
MTRPLTEPERPPSNSCVKNCGIWATIPAMMISEVPLPIPREVICSPSHSRNIVPPIRLITARDAEGHARDHHRLQPLDAP